MATEETVAAAASQASAATDGLWKLDKGNAAPIAKKASLEVL